MPQILNKQSRFIIIPYLDDKGHRKEVRLFGYTTDITNEQFEAIVNHPLLDDYFKTGELVVISDAEMLNASLSIISNAPMASTNQGLYPISSATDPKVNDKVYKEIQKNAKNDGEVSGSKILDIKPEEPKAKTK